MECCVGDVADAIETLAPPDLAAAWDNAGLQVGNTAWPVHLIWVALDPLPEVVSSACKADVDLLVTHHPLLFRPLKRVDAATPQGAMIALALKSDMAIYAAHTNLDAAAGGINDMLASKIGLKEVGLYTETLTDNNQHLVRIGRLPKKKSLILLARELKKSLDVHALKIAGDPNLEVSKVFLCSGSGGNIQKCFTMGGLHQVKTQGWLLFRISCDDVNHAGNRFRTIKRGSGTLDDFNPVYHNTGNSIEPVY